MQYEHYKFLHMMGLISMFIGMGGMITYSKGSSPFKGLIAGFHGTGLILLLIGGFGIAAKLHMGFPKWMMFKLVIWIVLGAMIVLAKRGILKGAALWGTLLFLGALAAFFGTMKPFN
ncbi:MAG: hypothetical protein GXP30_12415 [Verrucomicrobia bacterium]|nr:hypothetical protein [Verrucomicrobiota bacterium]